MDDPRSTRRLFVPGVFAVIAVLSAVLSAVGFAISPPAQSTPDWNSQFNSKYGTSDIDWLRSRIDPTARRYEGKPKFKYLLPLDDEFAERVKLLAKPYPKTRATSETSDTPGVHLGKGRAARTVALQAS